MTAHAPALPAGRHRAAPPEPANGRYVLVGALDDQTLYVRDDYSARGEPARWYPVGGGPPLTYAEVTHEAAPGLPEQVHPDGLVYGVLLEVIGGLHAQWFTNAQWAVTDGDRRWWCGAAWGLEEFGDRVADRMGWSRLDWHAFRDAALRRQLETGGAA